MKNTQEEKSSTFDEGAASVQSEVNSGRDCDGQPRRVLQTSISVGRCTVVEILCPREVVIYLSYQQPFGWMALDEKYLVVFDQIRLACVTVESAYVCYRNTLGTTCAAKFLGSRW